MKHALAALAAGAFCMMLWTSGAGAIEKDQEAADFIRTLGNQVTAVLDDKSMAHEERVARFYEMFKAAFDENEISAFALGKYRRTISDKKFAEYSELFGKYMTGLYANKFADYSGEDFVVTGSKRKSEQRSDVSAEIRRGDREPIALSFRMTRADNGRKINDVVIEGVSLLFTKRQEVTTVIAREGLETLLERLRKAVQLAELQ